MNRTFIQKLFKRLFLIEQKQKDNNSITDFNANDCSQQLHKAEAKHLLEQKDILDYIINDYIKTHGDK